MTTDNKAKLRKALSEAINDLDTLRKADDKVTRVLSTIKAAGFEIRCKPQAKQPKAEPLTETIDTPNGYIEVLR